jgi:hypothetical protein
MEFTVDIIFAFFNSVTERRIKPLSLNMFKTAKYFGPKITSIGLGLVFG